MKLFAMGHGNEPMDVPMGKHGFVQFEVGDGTINVSMERGKLKLHADGFSGPLKIMPLVTNEVLVEIGER
jgi:hypothetical protein